MNKRDHTATPPGYIADPERPGTSYPIDSYPGRLIRAETAEARVADLEAGIRRLCDNAATCYEHDVPERVVFVDTLRALVGDSP